MGEGIRVNMQGFAVFQLAGLAPGLDGRVARLTLFLLMLVHVELFLVQGRIALHDHRLFGQLFHLE